jgi:hypothetical protein
MIIRLIAKSRSIEIDDPKNFRAFSVRIEGAIEPAAQAELLSRIVVKQDGEHAWISEQALRDWPALKAEARWQDGLTGMIAAVQRADAVDDAEDIDAEDPFPLLGRDLPQRLRGQGKQ